ncbi:MAG TPA: asparagine--tRNA ligase [Candidatus Fimiplasma intestinipullorum]|uniref:Asparagine--tRNA ligase n=1 Tax=Candidatus Fimiplasma intestinipullorum TaxID=2840825 RepID=A0A9D1HPF7_9FIRM|nr:asparagine--tRNA ligase [Candidatus Fimiplasma intestinipullorum]
MFEFKTVRELYEMILNGEEFEIEGLEYVELEGWVRTHRNSGKVGFLALNDGTYFKNCQIVYEEDLVNLAEVKKITTGAAIKVMGKFKVTPQAKQPFEIVAREIVIESHCDADYPMQKKRHSVEYLREIPHLRGRANLFMAVYRVRSCLAMAIHEFFQNQGFVYIHTPIITGLDAEGAGETFSVSTTDPKPFFGKPASLSVSGQLHVEAFALTFRDVYTFGPTFRAENSNTATHASEFWMIEPEIAFADLEDDMDLIEDMIKYCIDSILDNCPAEMEFLDQYVENGLLGKLRKVYQSEFIRLDYTEAIQQLLESKETFAYPVQWGMDLATEHERYLCEKIYQAPVFIVNYPKDIKAFYMRQNADGRTVAACDLLVPGVGELVGGSQREERYDVLKERMEALGMDLEAYQWYLDLRRFGGVQHAGFGLGFERFLMYLTGVKNIRDVIPYPRTPRQLQF